MNKHIVILGVIGLLLSACDNSGGDSNNGEIIVTGDGNTVRVEIVDASDINENTPNED